MTKTRRIRRKEKEKRNSIVQTKVKNENETTKKHASTTKHENTLALVVSTHQPSTHQPSTPQPSTPQPTVVPPSQDNILMAILNQQAEIMQQIQKHGQDNQSSKNLDKQQAKNETPSPLSYPGHFPYSGFPLNPQPIIFPPTFPNMPYPTNPMPYYQPYYLPPGY